MGVATKPQDDAKAMKDEYVKGATIADLAAKYNHSEQEVEDVVTKEAIVELEVLPTQAEIDAKSAEAPKKDK